MDKLKILVKSNFLKDDFDTIFWGNPTRVDYQRAIIAYNNAGFQSKLDIETRLIKKIGKSRDYKLELAALHFMGLLINDGNRFNYLQTSNLGTAQFDRSQKQKIAEYRFFKMYYEFICKQNQKPDQHGNNFNDLNMIQQLEYCEMSVQQIKQVVQSQYMMNCNLKTNNIQVISLQIIDHILKTVSNNLLILHSYIQSHSKLIIEEDPLMIRINYIYENLIAISKPIILDKLKKLNSKIANKYSLPTYKIDEKINNEVQEVMKKKTFESRKFLLQKLSPKHEENPENTGSIGQLQMCSKISIQESDILLKCDEFMIN